MERTPTLRRWLPLLALLMVCAAFAAGRVRAAEPGSSKDPVITRSYLEQMYSWQYTTLAEGQTISLDMGANFVLRNGKAQVVGTDKEGLVDLTKGEELTDGQAIPLNHLIISPASDNRGLKALTSVVAITRGQSK